MKAGYTALIFAWLIALMTALPAYSTEVWAVGDGSNEGPYDDQVAAMIGSQRPDAFLYLGDVYQRGTTLAFERYQESYGRLFDLTFPTPGNHEWDLREYGYWPYWAERFNRPDFYSFNIGGWHIVSINSESEHGDGTAQLQWLQNDLAGAGDACTLAFYHRPRHSAGEYGDQLDMEPVWQLVRTHADLVLNGHDRAYQRIQFPGQPPELIVGTGGRGFYAVNPLYKNLKYYVDSHYGAVKLDLSPSGATYEFHTVDGDVLDRQSVNCGGRQIAPPPGPDDPEDEKGYEGEDGEGEEVEIRYRSRQPLKRTLRKGLALGLRCPIDCSASISVRVTHGRRTRVLGRLEATLEEGVDTDLVVRPRRRARRLLKGRGGRLAKKRRATVTVEIYDEYGLLASRKFTVLLS